MNQQQSRARLNAYTFIMRHLQEGIPEHSWQWEDEIPPRRSRAVLIGAALMVLVVVVVGVVALISPRHGVARHSLVLSRDSGQMYVFQGERLHPVSGLAAGRLVLGSSEKPALVTDKDIEGMAQGVPLGISQGPRALPEHAGRVGKTGQTWAMCDYAEPTTDRYFQVRATMLVGAVESSQLDEVRPTRIMAVHGDDVWLLERGHRRKVTGVSREVALQRGARVVSGALLASLVEMPSRPLSQFPADSGETSLCAVWRVEPGAAEPRLSVSMGDINVLWRLSADLAQQDDDGDRVDGFLLLGRRAVVGFAAPLVGGGAVQSALSDSQEAVDRQADLWLISDDGIRFGVQRDTLGTLGVGSETMPLPWAMISQLSAGPYLSPTRTGSHT